MRYKFIAILALLIVLWIAYHLIQNFRERSRIESLPKKVALLGSYSAKSGIAEAERIALVWDPGCQLQCIFMAFAGDPHSDDQGMAIDGIPIAPSGWNYRYFSSVRGWFLDLRLWPDGRCEASSFNGMNYLDTKPLPQEFLDSTTALSIAEQLYGKRFRDKGKLFRVPTRVTTWGSSVVGPRDPVPHRAIWQIEYLSTRERVRVDLVLTLDAVTGQELSAVEFVNSEMNVLSNNYGK